MHFGLLYVYSMLQNCRKTTKPEVEHFSVNKGNHNTIYLGLRGLVIYCFQGQGKGKCWSTFISALSFFVIKKSKECLEIGLFSWSWPLFWAFFSDIFFIIWKKHPYILCKSINYLSKNVCVFSIFSQVCKEAL